jgi:beta-lactamase class A
MNDPRVRTIEQVIAFRATALCLTLLCAHAQPDASALLTAKLLEKIRAIDAVTDGTIGVAAIDLSTGRIIAYNSDSAFPQASVIKVPVMAEIYRGARQGRLRLDQQITLAAADAVAGGELYPMLRRGPLTLTVRELVRAMIESSDNTAANRLIALVGMERVNASMHSLGLTSIQLRRIMLDSAAVRRGDENVAAPAHVARLMQLLWEGAVVDKEASAEMLAELKRVDGDFRKTVPGGIEVAAKTGEYPGSRTEAGIVFLKSRPFAFSVCATFLRPGANPIPDVAAVLWQYFDRLERSNLYGNRID